LNPRPDAQPWAFYMFSLRILLQKDGISKTESTFPEQMFLDGKYLRQPAQLSKVNHQTVREQSRPTVQTAKLSSHCVIYIFGM